MSNQNNQNQNNNNNNNIIQTQISHNSQSHSHSHNISNQNNNNNSNLNNTNTNVNTNNNINSNTNINLIEEFFYIYDEDNKLINILKEEFSDLKFFNYGSIIYFQKETEEETSYFPHVSELLENYEKIYSQTCYKDHLILRLTKCKKIFMYIFINFV